MEFEIEMYVSSNSDGKAMRQSVVLMRVSAKYSPNNNRMQEKIGEKVIFMK